MDLLILLASPLVIPAVLYYAGARSSSVWGLIRRGEATSGQGLYRTTRVTLWARGAAPLSVRAAAFTSFLLGQLIVPGILAALVGVVAMVVALVDGSMTLILLVLGAAAPTGLIVAGRLLGTGLSLLQRQPDAVASARLTARWELWHNGLLFVGLVVSSLVGDPEEQMACAVVAVPALLALAHGLLLQRAASALEAYNAAQEGAPEEDGPSLPFGAGLALVR